MTWLHTLLVWLRAALSLKGNGPEALVQTLVYGIIAMVLIPPVRRWWGNEFAKVHAEKLTTSSNTTPTSQISPHQHPSGKISSASTGHTDPS